MVYFTGGRSTVNTEGSMELILFLIIGFACIAALLAIRKFILIKFYLNHCQTTKGEVVDKQYVYPTVRASGLINQALEMLIVRFYLNRDEYMDVKWNEAIKRDCSVGSQVEISYLKNPADAKVNYKETALNDLKTNLQIIAILTSLAIIFCLIN